MSIDPLRLLILVALTLVSGVGDAQGFIHAARMWKDGALVWRELLGSALGFAVGIGSYWIAVRYFVRAGVLAPEVQTLVWFGATMIGVAVVSGRFLGWRGIDQVVATGVLLGLGWLVLRTE
jgi:hypothetical protein